MVIREKTVTARVPVYVAEDGKEFGSWTECVRHEQKLEEGRLFEPDATGYIPEMDGVVPSVCGWEAYDENLTYWFRPKTAKAADIISRVIGNGAEIHPGDTVCIMYENSEVSLWTTLDAVIGEMAGFIAAVTDRLGEKDIMNRLDGELEKKCRR